MLKKSFKQRLEDNPVVALSSAAVASGTVVAGVVLWLSGNLLEIRKGQYETEISELKNEISRVTKQFNSDRRIGKEGDENFIDIGKMQIPRSEVDRLDASYRSYMGGNVYVSKDDNLDFLTTNEFDLLFYIDFDINQKKNYLRNPETRIGLILSIT